MLNSMTVVGNLIKDVEFRTNRNSKTGATFSQASFGLGTNRSYRNDDGKWVDVPTGVVNVVVRDNAGAANVAESLSKGTRVLVTGSLESRSFENREGETVWITELIAEEVGVALRWHTVGEITKATPQAAAKQVSIPSMADWIRRESAEIDSLVESGTLSKAQATRAKNGLVDAYKASLGNANPSGVTTSVEEEEPKSAKKKGGRKEGDENAPF